MYAMQKMTSHEEAILNDFCHLLEKSKQLFNGLRDLPQHGYKHWQSYFGRTFDVYTKIWKFQQQHREVLDQVYGLRRWQIGDIASKIGQLYYHYYLRTSDMNYLYDSFSFYLAIRSRAYYSEANKENKPDLMVQKLRYYARFIVVCLLLNKMDFVRDLVKEFEYDVFEYGERYQPPDQGEWHQVLEEIRAFIEVHLHLKIFDPETKAPIMLQRRLNPSRIPPVERNFDVSLRLTDAIIVGSCMKQVKFGELSMDMFRILQTLERVPPQELDPGSASFLTGNATSGGSYGAPLTTPGTLPRGTAPMPNHHLPPFAGRRAPDLHEGGRQTSTSSLDGGPTVYNPTSGTGYPPSHQFAANPHHKKSQAGADRYPGSQAPQQLQYYPYNSTGYPNHQHPPLKQAYSAPLPPSADGGAARQGSNNPHKYLLYQPSFTQLNTYLATSFRELPACGALLFYISGDGSFPMNRGQTRMPNDMDGYMNGGVSTTTHHDSDVLRRKRNVMVKESRCIHPGDLCPYTRKPLFLIVDCDNSFAFKDLPNLFGQPLVCLMGPEEIPPNVFDSPRRGNLFTLFLHCPLLGVCSICNVHSMPVNLWDRAHVIVEKFLATTARILMRSQYLDHSYLQFYGDEFLRALILRYCFCCVVLRLHRSFRGASMRLHPQSQPALPGDEILEDPTLHRLVLDLANTVDLRQYFVFPQSVTSQPPPQGAPYLMQQPQQQQQQQIVTGNNISNPTGATVTSVQRHAPHAQAPRYMSNSAETYK